MNKYTLPKVNPKVWRRVIQPLQGYEANAIDFGGTATFVQICAKPCDEENAFIMVQLNDQHDAAFTLEADRTQIFNNGDLSIRKLAFASNTEIVVEVIAGLPARSG
jgi:hypothetical protein